uniref:Bax-mediated apoptosis inhibitor TEGT/BI-1 n=1 Tax=Hadrurus spadix TaxID=141984 RepID=A0A1W7R9G4_9SCOR
MATLTGFIESFNNRVEPPVQRHLKNVYSCLALSTLVAAAGAYIHTLGTLIHGNFFTSLIALGLMLALAVIPHEGGKWNGLRLCVMGGFSFVSGLSLGPILDVVIRVNPSIIPTAFLATCVIFVCFTLCALYSDKYKWIYIGGTLFSGLILTLLLGFISILTGSRMLFQIYTYLGLFIICGFVLYDTQMVVEKFRQGDNDYIWHSVYFFIDFIDIFRFLLVILTDKEQSRRKKD